MNKAAIEEIVRNMSVEEITEALERAKRLVPINKKISVLNEAISKLYAKRSILNREYYRIVGG